MKLLLPQEVQVRYVIPALRREFAKSLVADYGLRQKRAAELLGVTEAAVSNYFSNKRASEVKFSEDVVEKIKDACGRIVAEESTVMEEMYELSISNDVKKAMCRAHIRHDKNVNKGCDLCFKVKQNG